MRLPDLFNRRALREALAVNEKFKADREILKSQFEALVWGGQITLPELVDLYDKVRKQDRFEQYLGDPTVLPDDILQRLALEIARNVAPDHPLVALKQKFLDGHIPEDQFQVEMSAIVESLRDPDPITLKFRRPNLSDVDKLVINACSLDGVIGYSTTLKRYEAVKK